MYHHPKPFFRASRGLWYVQIRGKQINLGPDREQAWERYHELMRRAPESPATDVSEVTVLVDQYLEWCNKHRAPATYLWSRDRLQLFVSRHPRLAVAELRPWHVQQWIDACERLSSGSRRNHCRAIQRALRWAEQQGLIDRSPIAHIQKPRAGRRTTVIDEPEFALILEHAPNEAFRDLIRFAWLTGARAAECLAVEGRHVELTNRRIVFPVAEEKMERIPRIIYLSQEATAVVRLRLTSFFGRVFTNSRGRPWTADAVNCAFDQVRIRMGKKALSQRGITASGDEVNEFTNALSPTKRVRGRIVRKSLAELRCEAKRKLLQRLAKRHAARHCLTEFRHSWCHHALRRGVDSLTVSVLMGHADPSMVSRVYSHLNHAPDYLMEQAQRAAG